LGLLHVRRGALFEDKPAFCVDGHAQKKVSDWVFGGQD